MSRRASFAIAIWSRVTHNNVKSNTLYPETGSSRLISRRQTEIQRESERNGDVQIDKER